MKTFRIIPYFFGLILIGFVIWSVVSSINNYNRNCVTVFDCGEGLIKKFQDNDDDGDNRVRTITFLNKGVTSVFVHNPLLKRTSDQELSPGDSLVINYSYDSKTKKHPNIYVYKIVGRCNEVLMKSSDGKYLYSYWED